MKKSKQTIIDVDGQVFRSQYACEVYTRQLIEKIGYTDSVQRTSEESMAYFKSLCERHPHSSSKMRDCVDFRIGKDPFTQRGYGLSVIHADGSVKPISWRMCVTGKGKSTSTLFNASLRHSVSDQIWAFKQRVDVSSCVLCGCSLVCQPYHVDHDNPTFMALVQDFVVKNNVCIPSTYGKTCAYAPMFKPEDAWIGDLFAKHHETHATLRIVCVSCNLTRPKKG